MTTRSSGEIEAQIGELEVEHTTAVADELARKDAAFRREREAEDERLKREAKGTWERETAPFERMAREQKEDEERERRECRERLEYICSLLPSPETMPRCEDCGRHLVFQEVPPIVTPYQRWLNSPIVPSVNLRCPSCGSVTRAEFINENFPLSFD